MLNKIQIVFLICALPALLLPFGPTEPAKDRFWKSPRQALPIAAAMAALALTALFLAKDILIYGLSTDSMENFSLPALALSAETYWAIIALWIGAGMIAYCIIWRVSAIEGFSAAFATVAGCMSGLLVLSIQYHPNNAAVVFHPFEQLFRFAASSVPELKESGALFNADRLGFVAEAIWGVIARRTFILESSPRPTIFLEWFVIFATVYAWRKGERHLVLQVAALMLTVWAMDVVGMARGLKQEYFLFTDPLVIIAAALLVSRVASFQNHRWRYAVGTSLMAAHLVVSQAEPIKHLFKTDGPEVLCNLYHGAKRVEHLPVCELQQLQPS
jgi:hypothetical protein